MVVVAVVRVRVRIRVRVTGRDGFEGSAQGIVYACRQDGMQGAAAAQFARRRSGVLVMGVLVMCARDGCS